MAEYSQNNNPQDDEVLARLYKEGAKDTPPAKLNSEILNYAASPDANASDKSAVGSHFGGGWKVPMSLAASIVIVFALLVQLDQTHDSLDLPPIPEISTQQDNKEDALKSAPIAEDINQAESITDDADSVHQENQIIESYSADERETIEERVAKEPVFNDVAPMTTPAPKAAKKLEQKQQIDRTRSYEAPVENTKPTSSSKSKTADGYAPILTKPQAIEKQSKEATGAPAGMMNDRSMPREVEKDRMDSQSTSVLSAESDAAIGATQESEFAPLPVEDWLLMIEKLVARKDYAEAARQLRKFKQAHPKVNVEDLEAKIP